MSLNTAYSSGTVHTHCLVKCAQSLCKFQRNNSWQASLLCFDLCQDQEEIEDSHLIGALWWVFCERPVHLRSWAGSVCTYDCICAWQDSVWRWEFLSSATNVSAEHPVDWEHVEADGASAPLLIKLLSNDLWAQNLMPLRWCTAC